MSTTTYRARLFRNGGSQAIRLPRECRFPGDEVILRKQGDRVIIEAVERGWSRRFLAIVAGPRKATLPARRQPRSAEEREALA